MKIARALFALQLLCAAEPAMAQVTPDRTTATTVTRTPSGSITVGIAPANKSGISHNAYTEFSTPKDGVRLNNRGIDATTIVNEVTSTRRSLLNGPVEVLGSRAHVVVANPNGITVDGARFLNTGGVALSGGRVRYEAVGASGLVNAVLPTGDGGITVTGAGLSGAMTTLQIIAGRIKIDGQVANTHISPSANIALVAGRSEVTLDSSVSPLVTLRPFASRRDLDARAKDILVDITPRGSLSASRVTVAVNARGAGVSYAGRGQATIGDFRIDANGKVTTKGAIIRAEKSVRIAANEIKILNDSRRQSELSSITKAVTLLARAGDIALHGAVTGAERADDDRASMGGVTLKAAGRVSLFSESADRLAIAFSSRDDLFIHAQKGLVNDTGRLLSNATTVIRTGGTLANITDAPTLAAETRIIKRRYPGVFGSLFGLKRVVSIQTFQFGPTRIPGQMGYIAGEAIDIRAERLENDGEIDALDGSLIIETASVVNTGFPTGNLSFTKNCGVFCWSEGKSSIAVLGGKINAAGSAEIKASGKVENAGDIVAYGNLSVSAPTVIGRAIFTPEFASRPAGFYNAFTGSTALASLLPIGGSFLAPSGTVTIDSKNPLILSGGAARGQVATEVPGGTAQGEANQPKFSGGLHHIGLLRSWLE
jgi:filamentous hemagglutinin family protein